MNEIFKNIFWYQWLYQISNLWNIKSLNYRWNWKEKILKSWKDYNWYLIIWLSKNKKVKNIKIHRLVAQAFLWLDIENSKIKVCHKDDNSLNNNKDNLFLWTQKDNIQDCVKKWRNQKHRKWKFWKDHNRSKKLNQYTKNWEFIKTWDSVTDIQRETWIHLSSISSCCLWKTKSAWWFSWKFIN